MIDVVEVKEVASRDIWIEDDIFGNKHVMIRHNIDGFEPVTYCTFFYDHRYTSNSSIRQNAINMAVALGASEPIEFKTRPFDWGDK